MFSLQDYLEKKVKIENYKKDSILKFLVPQNLKIERKSGKKHTEALFADPLKGNKRPIMIESKLKIYSQVWIDI